MSEDLNGQLNYNSHGYKQLYSSEVTFIKYLQKCRIFGVVNIGETENILHIFSG